MCQHSSWSSHPTKIANFLIVNIYFAWDSTKQIFILIQLIFAENMFTEIILHKNPGSNLKTAHVIFQDTASALVNIHRRDSLPCACLLCDRYFSISPSNSCLQKGRPTKICDGALHKISKKIFFLQCSKLAALHLLLAGQHIGQPAVGGGESKNSGLTVSYVRPSIEKNQPQSFLIRLAKLSLYQH